MNIRLTSISARAVRGLLLALWAMAVLAGLGLLTEYDTAPGAQGSPSRDWPAGSRARLDNTRPTLLMFAHPRCPCTRASIGELEQIVAGAPRAGNLQIFFRAPAEPGDDWTRTDLWEQAEAIPGAKICADPNGNEATRFGVKTSGHVLVFGTDGKLLFSGGITAARGHAGENPGRSAVSALLSGGVARAPGHSVFGCELFEPSQRCAIGETCPAE